MATRLRHHFTAAVILAFLAALVLPALPDAPAGAVQAQECGVGGDQGNRPECEQGTPGGGDAGFNYAKLQCYAVTSVIASIPGLHILARVVVTTVCRYV